GLLIAGSQASPPYQAAAFARNWALLVAVCHGSGRVKTRAISRGTVLGMTLMLASACQKGPALSKHSEVSTFETPSLGPIGSDRLGVLLDQVPVYAGTSKNA